MVAAAEAKAMLAKYEASLAGEQKDLFIAYARRFLKFARRKPMDRATVLAYLDDMREDEYSDGTIAFNFRVVGRLFRANGLDWPFRKGEGPRIRESEVYAPALHPQLIRRMIETAVKGDLGPDETAFLALSTTYGLRPAELRSVTMEDIHPDLHQILIRTKKHGRERWHDLPDAIIPHVSDYSYPEISAFMTIKMFREIEHRSGIEHIEEVGWHSIRRTLVTLVGQYCAELVVNNFFRWAPKDMAQHYTAARFVGLGEDEMQISGTDKTVDELVFAQHPFLSYWKGVGDVSS